MMKRTCENCAYFQVCVTRRAAEAAVSEMDIRTRGEYDTIAVLSEMLRKIFRELGRACDNWVKEVRQPLDNDGTTC